MSISVISLSGRILGYVHTYEDAVELIKSTIIFSRPWVTIQLKDEEYNNLTTVDISVNSIRYINTVYPMKVEVAFIFAESETGYEKMFSIEPPQDDTENNSILVIHQFSSALIDTLWNIISKIYNDTYKIKLYNINIEVFESLSIDTCTTPHYHLMSKQFKFSAYVYGSNQVLDNLTNDLHTAITDKIHGNSSTSIISITIDISLS